MSRSTYPDENGRVTIKYHQEDDHWWGEVDGWTNYFCTASTLDGCRDLAREGIPFGVDERLLARSVMFLQVHETDWVKPDPHASETFQLYVPEDV